MRHLLLLGAEGQVGWQLQRTLACLGKVICYTRSEVDLADEKALRQAIQHCKPEIIVNAAAYTAVDRAETEVDLAYQVNTTAPQIMAEEAKNLKALFVHYSTDYIFDGQSSTPYTEESTPSPLNVYGASKLAGEQAIQSSCADALILRTSWVYGWTGHNFLKTMLRLGLERPKLRIVNDQVGAPTWSRLIAEATAFILVKLLSVPQSERTSLYGIYHLTAQGEASWFGFAEHIFQSDALQEILKTPPILEAISTGEYPLPAKRPSYSVLSNTKLIRTFNLQMPTWDEALRLCLKELNVKNLVQIP